MGRRAIAQFFLQHFMKNLERARPVNESATGLGHERQLDRSAIAIFCVVVVQIKCGCESGGKIEQLPNRYARFSWIIAPRRDRVRDRLVEIE